MFRIESLLAARLFLHPETVGKRVYFISNLSGRLSLYAMDEGGSVPEPLLPSNIALQNPDLIGGIPFRVFPKLGKIMLMLDQDGNEVYQPMVIPLMGGFPEPAFGDKYANSRLHWEQADPETGWVTFGVESQSEETVMTSLANLQTGEVIKVASSPFGLYPADHTRDFSSLSLVESYTVGDGVVYVWNRGSGELTCVYGKPMGERQPGEVVALNGIGAAQYTPDEGGLLLMCAVFSDTYGLAYLDLEHPGSLSPVEVVGLHHQGMGEMVNVEHLAGSRYLLEYNIDGCSWLYEAEYQSEDKKMQVRAVLCGEGALSNGTLASHAYEAEADRFAFSFSTATSPTQISILDGEKRDRLSMQTHERVLGIAPELLSPGEDASFISFDGTRTSARLYMPAPTLGFKGARPVVYYIHGGPQSQERPDFAWFSMPLIQFLTLNGFAVFVPNVRGSTGYGLNYTKQVDRDWGGQDRLDHTYALELLGRDPRLDISRAAVVGRSYGGYMTLTLAGRHAALWKAAVDMFGPFDLLTFSERIPETWKPYFRAALGDPSIPEDHAFLVERSPKSYIDQITCPLLVIQGRNDPRVAEPESHDLVDHLLGLGKQVEYMVFENEGHDVLKYENRVRCYQTITDFFKVNLKP